MGSNDMTNKSSIGEIRERFDADVERFSNLETGQAATIDAPLAMELITEAAIAATPSISRVLDLGCGAGNNTIRLIRAYSGEFACDLSDLSQPMLDRAKERIAKEKHSEIRIFEGDFRTIDFEDSHYDVILAAAVLHHLRDDHDWESAFTKIFQMLRPGGSFWVTDLVSHESAEINDLMWKRYGAYLESLGGVAYRNEVLDYIDKEDSPRSVTYQIGLMRKVGFTSVEVLHKNSCFAAFGGIKAN
jgi:tRNA (cmo5U34)-methyltransferase